MTLKTLPHLGRKVRHGRRAEGCFFNGGTRQFQQKFQMEDGEGKIRVSLGVGKCFQGLWFMLGKELQIVTSDWGCSEQCSHHLPSVRGSSDCLCPGPGWAPWLRVLHAGYGGGGKGKLGETLFLIFSPRYTGKRSTSNMVIVEVSLLSGFVLAPESRMSVRSLESGWWCGVSGTIHAQGEGEVA